MNRSQHHLDPPKFVRNTNGWCCTPSFWCSHNPEDNQSMNTFLSRSLMRWSDQSFVLQKRGRSTIWSLNIDNSNQVGSVRWRVSARQTHPTVKSAPFGNFPNERFTSFFATSRSGYQVNGSTWICVRGIMRSVVNLSKKQKTTILQSKIVKKREIKFTL